MTKPQRAGNEPSRIPRRRGAAREQPKSAARVTELLQPDRLSLQQSVSDPGRARPVNILALQRRAGNEAVSGLIQTKLRVGAVGDKYEQEADRVATQVLAMQVPAKGPGTGIRGHSAIQREDEPLGIQTRPLAASIAPVVQRQEVEELQMKPVAAQQVVQRQEEEEDLQTKPVAAQQVVQRQEEEEELQMKPVAAQQVVQRQDEEEDLQMKPVAAQQVVQRQGEEEDLQMKPVAAQQVVQRQDEEEEVQAKHAHHRADDSFDAGPSLESRLAANKGGGRPLSDEMRAFMEPRFGADFSGVRVHTGTEAAMLNRDLKSRAFTHGNDVYFRSGEYDPGTSSGKELLAHELTHTLQQGATDHIRGWWPKGHRLVTELAFQEGGLGRFYGAAARRFLIDRSPDMDFIQDVFETMGEGGKEAKPRLQLYRNLIKTGRNEQAKAMYQNNDIHIRRPAYLLMHGEAGAYKEPDASAKNAAVTAKFVDKAVALWNDEQHMEALSVLSDALHQAADRGSHEEGNEFGGHDVRLQLGVMGKGGVPGFGTVYGSGAQDWPTQPWEREYGGEKTKGVTWEPDNFDVNRKGAVHGVACVIGALKKFVQGIGLQEGEQVNVRGKTVPERRRLKLGGVLPAKSSGVGGSMGAQLAGAKSGGGMEALEKVFEETKVGMQEAYKVASQAPGDVVPDGFADLLQDGMRFYAGGLARSEEYQTAHDKFHEWSRPRVFGGLKKSRRVQESKDYYRRVVQAAEGRGRDKVLTGKHIKLAYKAVYLEPLPVVEEEAEATGVELATQMYLAARKQFKNWGKSRLKGGLKRRNRILKSYAYYREKVAGTKGQALKLRAGAITSAYYSVFKEGLAV